MNSFKLGCLCCYESSRVVSWTRTRNSLEVGSNVVYSWGSRALSSELHYKVAPDIFEIKPPSPLQYWRVEKLEHNEMRTPTRIAAQILKYGVKNFIQPNPPPPWSRHRAIIVTWIQSMYGGPMFHLASYNCKLWTAYPGCTRPYRA